MRVWDAERVGLGRSMLQGFNCGPDLSIKRYLELRIFGFLFYSLFTTVVVIEEPRTNISGISFALALSAL